MPGIEYADSTLLENESLKGFDSPDALAKGYLDLHTKVSAGDISLLPEEIRKDPSLSTFKNVSDVAKSFIETKKLVGSIKKAPEKPDGYKFTPVQDLHAGIQNVEGTQKALAEYFHKIGLDNEKADAVQQGFLNMISQSLKNQEQARAALAQENETKLRAEWGADYDKNFDRITKVIERVGGKDAVNAFNFKDSPTALKVLGKVVSLLSEDSIGKLGEGSDQQITEKSAAEKRIQEIIKENNTKDSPLLNEKHKDHAKVKAEWEKMHQVAYGP